MLVGLQLLTEKVLFIRYKYVVSDKLIAVT